jgi:transcription elongation GreA/GreB family factor
MELKKTLFEHCQNYANNRLQTVEAVISSNQKALASETKSSAGDKQETGRAMLQLEMEKAGQQFAGIHQMKETLARTDISKTGQMAHLGSVIFTEKANYFLSISAGQLTVENKLFYAISLSSPIGKLLLGKQKNSVVVFNGNEIKLLNVL